MSNRSAMCHFPTKRYLFIIKCNMPKIWKIYRENKKRVYTNLVGFSHIFQRILVQNVNINSPYSKPKKNCSYFIYFPISNISFSTMLLYSSKPPSKLFTVPLEQTQSSLHTIRISLSSWETRITPP